MATNGTDHYIYAYVDPRDNIVRYVGQGQNNRRLATHRHNEQYGVYPWLQRLKALGLKPVRFIVLEKLTKPQANRWEIDLIEFIGRRCEETGPLLNLSAGGSSGSNGCKRSAETCRKISESLKGVPKSEAARRNMAKAHTGTTRTIVSCRKQSEALKGRPQSEEHRRKRSKALKGNTNSKGHTNGKGHKHSEESRKKMSETKRRKNLIRRFWRNVFDSIEREAPCLSI